MSGSGTNFGPPGGTGTVAVSVSRECTWAASNEGSWIALTGPREGQGDGTVAFRVTENADPVARKGAVVVSGARVDVTQGAAPCRFDVAGPGGPIGAAGGEARTRIGTHSACAWSAASGVEWISVAPASGRGPGEVMVRVGPNGGPERRAMVSIADARIEVVQSAQPLPPPPDPPPPPPPQPPPQPPPPPPPQQCTFGVTPAERNVAVTGGVDSFRVTAPSGCSWIASTTTTWIAIVGSQAGTGNGDVQYAVAPNLLAGPRQGVISVGTATHTVSQPGFLGDDDDDDDDDDDRDVELTGRVDNLSGTCPSLRFTVSGTPVITSNRTRFNRGDCRDVRNGRQVTVEGTRQNDGAVDALRVVLERE